MVNHQCNLQHAPTYLNAKVENGPCKVHVGDTLQGTSNSVHQGELVQFGSHASWGNGGNVCPVRARHMSSATFVLSIIL